MILDLDLGNHVKQTSNRIKHSHKYMLSNEEGLFIMMNIILKLG
ncbi:hypothetical protein [Aestuariivivens sediminis]|nr:hypothetical protein [Aestuariivivens sediminis]